MNRQQRRQAQKTAKSQQGHSSNHIDYLISLAEQHRDAGRFSHAEEVFREVLANLPHSAEAHHNLGYVLYYQNKINEAALCFERALSLKPNLAEAHNMSGNIFDHQGNSDEAVACYLRALANKPDYATAHNNLGRILEKQKRFSEAETCYQRALAIKPDYAIAHNNLGGIFNRQNKLNEAASCVRRALALRPDLAEAHFNLGNILMKQGEHDEAASCYEQALAINPDFAEAYNDLGVVLMEQSKLSEAEARFGESLAINPNSIETHYNRSTLRTFRPHDDGLAALEELALRADRFSDSDKIYLHFALGKALDDTGNYARAFEHLLKGSTMRRQEIHYSESWDAQQFKRIIDNFNPSLFSRLHNAGNPSSVPIFILGMPRSGSTLVEQIISSHPQVHGAGELMNLRNVIINLPDALDNSISYPEYLTTLDANSVRKFGEAYVNSLPKLPDGKTRITDKMPDNFQFVGMIKLILPNAKIIHTMRDPVDTCFSCFSKRFPAGKDYSYDLGELGRYYRRYSELMNYWRSILPAGSMLDFAYEELVDDFEVQARRLIEYCGLPWDERCLSFYKNKRTVSTASNVQVRQPLYRSSLQRWRQYESYLGPLLVELGLNTPHVSAREKASDIIN